MPKPHSRKRVPPAGAARQKSPPPLRTEDLFVLGTVQPCCPRHEGAEGQPHDPTQVTRVRTTLKPHSRKREPPAGAARQKSPPPLRTEDLFVLGTVQPCCPRHEGAEGQPHDPTRATRVRAMPKPHSHKRVPPAGAARLIWRIPWSGSRGSRSHGSGRDTPFPSRCAWRFPSPAPSCPRRSRRQA